MNAYNYVITADSGCDLPADFLAKHGVVPIRMHYVVDNETYTDDLSLSLIHISSACVGWPRAAVQPVKMEKPQQSQNCCGFLFPFPPG